MQWVPKILIWTIYCLKLIQSLPFLNVSPKAGGDHAKWDSSQPKLVYPLLHSADSSKSSSSALLVLKTKGEALYIELKPNHDLIGSYSAKGNISRSCHFYGKVLSPFKGAAAISMCESRNRMTGTIFVDKDAYVIYPLDQLTDEQKYFQRESSFSNDIDPHVISKVNNPSEYCGVKHDAEDSAPNDISTRIRRSAAEPRKVIETAVYVDHPLYRKFIMEEKHSEAELADMVLAIINQVQIIYNYQSLNTKFKIVVVKLEFLKADSGGPDPADGDVDMYLDNFCSWQSGRNPPESSEGHWDHAIMLSGYDLHKFTGGKKNKKVLGLAWINGMCRPKHSCTLNEGSSFEAAFVIAHEMGHSLGMQHDGRGNNCNPSGFLMAEKTGPGRVTWSSCSNEYLTRFFQKGRGQCLEDDNSSHEQRRFTFDNILPGHLFNLHEQCRLSLGSNYRPHIMPKQPFNNVCRELWCVSGLWASIAHPALEGSSCGIQKECIQGKCQPKNNTDSTEVSENASESSTEKSVMIQNMLADFLENLRLTLDLILP